MYESFFGLKERPFSLLPDPSFFYLSKIHQEALTLIEYGLYNQTGFTVLSGEVGSGKTTLMRYLLEKLGDDLTVGLISHTHQSIGQIMDWVCVAFDLQVPAGDKIRQHQALVDFLLDQYSRGKKTLLIIDEAQNLGLERLEEIRLLSNINADRDLVFQLLLLGQPQLREQLRSPDLEQFVQRVSASYHLGRLTAEDTFYYIRHRLRIAGGHKAIFTPDACHAVFHYSKGVPRIINLICETALVFSYGAGEKRITGEAIDGFVKSDASHLLLAINNEDRQSAPDYGTIFEETSDLVQHEESDWTQEEAADIDVFSDFEAVASISEPPKRPAQAGTNEGAAHDEEEAAPDRLAAALRTAEQDIGRKRAGTTTPDAPAASGQANKDAASSDETSDDLEGVSVAELIKPSGTGRRWTGEAIAIAAGVLLGIGLVGWYLVQQSTREGAPSTAAGAVALTGPDSSTQMTAPHGYGPTPEREASTQADAKQQIDPDAGDAAGTVGAAAAPTAPTTASKPVATATNGANQSGPAGQNASEPAGDASEPVSQSLDRIAGELEAHSLPVEGIGPRSMKVDFSRLIRFKDGSTTLDGNAERILEEFSSVLKQTDGVQLKVVAHTDTKGPSAANMTLSEKRAKNIADFIASQGIDGARIEYDGRGETEPKVDAEQEKVLGPWINRRVEVELTAPPVTAE